MEEKGERGTMMFFWCWENSVFMICRQTQVPVSAEIDDFDKSGQSFTPPTYGARSCMTPQVQLT